MNPHSSSVPSLDTPRARRGHRRAQRRPWGVADIPDLHGRTAVVTGANSGLGLEVARSLLASGAHVVLACRSASRGSAARDELVRDTGRTNVEVRPLDLASLSSVAEFAAHAAATLDRLDVLVNNAGLMAIDESRTADGFEMQFGVNHLGHAALTHALFPLLTRTTRSRVVNVASMGHRLGRFRQDDPMFERHGYRRWPAYFQSKLANLLFTSELQRRFEAAGVTTLAVAAHPGASHTDLGTEGTAVSNRLVATVVPRVTQSAAAGALPILRAATDPDVRGGEFYGPRWIVRGRPVLETPSRRARRVDDAATLWTLTERLTGRIWPEP